VGLEPPAKRTWSTLSYDELKDQERKAFEAFRSSVKLPRKRAHLVEGNPSLEIPRFAKELGADLVVMGALSRSGLERVFIGNTAEQVLNSLECDVLVVKPERFTPRVAREPRGMRIQLPAPLMAS